VPENLRTAELCLTAVKKNGGALQYVPEKFKEQVREVVEIPQVKAWSGKWRED